MMSLSNTSKFLRIIITSSNATKCLSTTASAGENDLRQVMQYVPQSVVVVSTRSQSDNVLRGITCSSFTSVSLNPPIVSFCMQSPSRFHDLLSQSSIPALFAVNVLSETQANTSIHFSTPVTDESRNQFEAVPHSLDKEFFLPLIEDSVAHLLCSTADCHEIGDHYVWYGNVLKTIAAQASRRTPLLYFGRSYRSVGDDTFIAAFEDTTLPYDFWTHKAHLRVAWNYLKTSDLPTALNKVREGINRFNAKNSDKIMFGYSETVTVFYITMVHKAMTKKTGTQNADTSTDSFEQFLIRNQHLLDRSLPFKFYSQELFFSEKAKAKFYDPDLAEFRDSNDDDLLVYCS